MLTKKIEGFRFHYNPDLRGNIIVTHPKGYEGSFSFEELKRCSDEVRSSPFVGAMDGTLKDGARNPPYVEVPVRIVVMFVESFDGPVKSMLIPENVAQAICQMAAVCFNEGLLGDDTDELMAWIAKEYPDLREEFSFLPCPSSLPSGNLVMTGSTISRVAGDLVACVEEVPLNCKRL